MTETDLAATVRALLEHPLAADGIELVDAQVGAGLVRVLVDRDGGIDLDGVAEATERVSTLLDAADPIPSRYTLEVSSPGIERPLRTPEHFRRFVGSRVAVKATAEFEGERRIEGGLASADSDGITVELPDGTPVTLSYDRIERARTVFEWESAPKPGRPSGSKGRQKKAS